MWPSGNTSAPPNPRSPPGCAGPWTRSRREADETPYYLSGGEKQRIGIARALYFRPKVLFLDEPTSSLDSKNEKLILEDIYKLGKNRTILIISHRTKIFKYCKKILNIKDGKVEILYNYKDLI